MNSALRIHGRCVAVAAWLLGLSTSVGLGDNFALDWWTFTGGGSTTAGGAYSVTGAIGQPDACVATLSGGRYEIEGGFWPGLPVPPPPERPALSITVTGSELVVSWAPAGSVFTLEVTDNLSSDAWNPAPGGSGNPVRLPVNKAAQFFRLRKP